MSSLIILGVVKIFPPPPNKKILKIIRTNVEQALGSCVKMTSFFTQKIQKQEKGNIKGGLSDFYTKNFTIFSIRLSEI